MDFKKIFTASGVFIASFLYPLLLYAGPCAMCKMGLEQGGGSRLTTGFYYSILLIVAVPLIIIGSAGFYFYRATKHRLRNEHEAGKIHH